MMRQKSSPAPLAHARVEHTPGLVLALARAAPLPRQPARDSRPADRSRSATHPPSFCPTTAVGDPSTSCTPLEAPDRFQPFRRSGVHPE